MRAVEYGLDVVAVRIDYERSVVAGVIRALSWFAVGDAAGFYRGFEKLLHDFTARGLKREVNAASEMSLCRRAILGGHAQFVRPEEIIPASADRNSESREDSLVKSFAHRKVAHHELEMIEQPPSV